MKWLIKYVFWLSVVNFIATTGSAQQPLDQIRFEHITVNNGLAHSDAMCAEQDAAGFIWIGTNSGINRYDGYELKKYSLPLNTQSGLSGNRIRDLYADVQGRLWVGAENSGLSLFDADHNRFVNVSQRARPSVNSSFVSKLQLADVEVITADRAGRIWVGTRATGLFVLSLNNANEVVHIERIALPTPGEVDYGVSALAADRDGTIWIGTASRGLWSVNLSTSTGSQPTVQAAPLAAQSIRALFLDRRGGLWIGADQQIFWVNEAKRKARRSFSEYSLPQSLSEIECICFDSFGRLWVGSNHGLHRWESRPTTKLSSEMPVLVDKHTTFLPEDRNPSGINAGRIEQVFEDRNQILWISTPNGGLNKVNLRDKPFMNLHRRIDEHPTLADNSVNTILKDEPHNCLWIGTSNGFSRYDLTTKTYQNYVNQSLPDGATGIAISAFCQATDGTLWVSTRSNGLFTLSNNKLRVHTKLSDGSRLSGSRLETIIEDRYGTFWVAAYDLGLIRLNRQGQLLQRFHTGNSNVPTNSFTFLLYDKEKNLLWASTQNAGVLKFNVTPTSLELVKQFCYKADDSTSLSVNYAWPLLKDHNGQIWIGTIGGGLNLLTTNPKGKEVIRRFDRQLPISDVECILEDENGHIWAAGTGLIRFDPASGQWLPYEVEDGIQSNSFKVGAAWRASDGMLYFGGIKGITYFQPRLIRPDSYAPIIHLTGLRIFNKPVKVNEPVNGHILLTTQIDKIEHITLRASDNDFSLDFVGLNFANSHKNTYAYRLIGYNDDWVIPAPEQRSASFANLPAGEYTFEVKAGNGEGKWSAKPASLHITVLSPWWKTEWAYLVYILLIGGALWLYRRVEMAQQALKNKLALEQVKAEAEKEVIDAKLRFFTNVSHELRTPLTLILGPMEELASAKGSFQSFREKMNLMLQQTRKLLDLVNQLMEFRKVESGHVALRTSKSDIISFLTELFMIFRFKADELQIDYTLSTPSAPVTMYFDRSKLEIMLTNLLANALKYTPRGSKINVTVTIIGSPDKVAAFEADRLVNNYLQITVRDWGVGMNDDEVKRIFDSYYQASNTETMRIMGTGIGLALVKQYAEAHSGDVTVQSEPCAGTAFTIRLPFGMAHLSPTDIVEELLATELLPLPYAEPIDFKTDSDTNIRLPVAGSARILVVEDNNQLRQYLQQLFEPAFSVSVATDGLEGWEKTLSLLPDLVVSDVMMPQSDGLTLCRKIKQHPKTEHIPVILLTARVAAVHELEGLEMGADEYMAKPFNPKILYAKTATILQGRLQLKEYYHRQILLEPTNVAIPDPERRLLEKAMALVEASLRDPDFNVPMLVRKMAMSQSAFYRQIKAITGQSVIEFIRDVRMKRAAQLLATNSFRISEVAALVGMEDLQHFRKTFMSVFGVSPSEYAKQHREPTDVN